MLWSTIFAKSLDDQLTVLHATAVPHLPVSVHPSHGPSVKLKTEGTASTIRLLIQGLWLYLSCV